MSYFPYPYSGVHFAYSTNNLDRILAAGLDANRESISNAMTYYNNLSSTGKLPLGSSAYIYPVAGNENFLTWIKIIQYVLHTPEVYTRYSGLLSHFPPAFKNLHPGNPHMMYRWLELNAPEETDFIELVSDNDFQYVKNDSRWNTRYMLPIDETGLNFINLQYLEPSASSSSISGDDVYCGDIQMAWELAILKRNQGNFIKCRNKYLDQVRLVGKTRARIEEKPSLEDIILLMNTRPAAIKQKQDEVDALQKLIELQEQELKTLDERLASSRVINKTNADKLGIAMTTKRRQLSGLLTKRRELQGQMAEFHVPTISKKRAKYEATVKYPVVPFGATTESKEIAETHKTSAKILPRKTEVSMTTLTVPSPLLLTYTRT